MEMTKIMKRFTCLIIAIALILFNTFAIADYDFSQMTDKELSDFIDQAQAELKKRSKSEEKSLVIYDEDGIKISFTGIYRSQHRKDAELFYFEYIAENNSSNDLEFCGRDCSVNDWEVGYLPCYGFPKAGKKAKEVMCIDIKPASISNFDEIEEIEFTLCLYFNRSSLSRDADAEKVVTLKFENGEFYVSK